MATLNLSDQNLEKTNILPKLIRLKQLMEQRKPIWERLSEENMDKQKGWINSNKDPIMSIAWDIYKYLRDNFFGGMEDGNN